MRSDNSRANATTSTRVVVDNILFGATGRVWRTILHFVFTPIFVALLGPESYGLVTFNATLTLSLLFLDQSVSPVLIREFGRLSGRAGNASEMANLLRSLEWLSTVIAAGIGLSVLLFSPLVAGNWINATTLSGAEVTNAVRLMGLNIACLWPSFLYGSGLVALHRQDKLLRIQVTIGTLQIVGAALLLWLVSADIAVFLAWQVGGAALTSVLLRGAVWRTMPAISGRPRMDWSKLRAVWRFAAGTLLIGITTSILTQADKWLVAKWLTLDQFAAYGMSFFLGFQISALMIAPVGVAIQPYFARLVGDGDQTALAREYHRWTQVLVLLSVTVLGGLAVFALPLLRLWLGAESPLVEPVAKLLPWVLAGNILNSIMAVPFILQMAAGWVRLSLFKNIIASALFIPALLYFVPRYGAIAGAGCWIALNAGYYVFEAPLMHRRLLRGELMRWWSKDTILPLLAASAMFWALTRVLPRWESPMLGTLQAGVASLLVMGLMFLILPHTRELAMTGVRRVLRRREVTSRGV